MKHPFRIVRGRTTVALKNAAPASAAWGRGIQRYAVTRQPATSTASLISLPRRRLYKIGEEGKTPSYPEL